MTAGARARLYELRPVAVLSRSMTLRMKIRRDQRRREKKNAWRNALPAVSPLKICDSNDDIRLETRFSKHTTQTRRDSFRYLRKTVLKKSLDRHDFEIY